MGACAEVTNSGDVKDDTLYKYAGQHVGEVDIFGNVPFNIDYLFHDFLIPSDQLNSGDKFAITIELSPGLSLTDFKFKDIQSTNLGGNKYEVIFTYGTEPWKINTSLEYAFSRLNFLITLNCATANLNDLWYKIGGELRKQAPTCGPVVFKCNTTKLKGFCGNGPCADGLVNGQAELKRTNIGLAIDQNGKPILNSTSTNAEFRNFITGDILEIKQESRAQITTQDFKKIKFVVEKDNSNSNATLVENSGKVIVDGVPVAQNLTVTENENTFEFVYVLGAPLSNNQSIELALSLKAGKSNLGLKQFPVKSYLLNANDEEFFCGNPYTATGLYVPTNFKFYDGNVDFIECTNDTNKVLFKAEIVSFSYQDSFFQNEYRPIFYPTTATINVTNYVTMTGVKVVVNNQTWLNNNNATTITGLNVKNQAYEVDLAKAIEDITAQVLGANNGLNYLDEGFELELVPIVSLDECEPKVTAKSEILNVNLKGTIVDGKAQPTIFNETKKLEYFTGVGTLTIKTSNDSSIGFFSPDGTEVNWVVKIESEGSRNFNSVWFAKNAGNLNIKSVQEVSNYAGVDFITTVLPTNGIYQLGNFTSKNARYFLIKANVNVCSIEELGLIAGFNCQTNSYPTSIATAACTINEVVLEHREIVDIIQTEIFEQFNGVDTKPNLCEDIWYTVQLHNGGDSKLNNLKITIPLNTAPGLVFDRFEIGSVYDASAAVPTTYISGGSSNIVDNVLTITLPNDTTINTLERIRIRVYFKINSCDLRSGSKHTVSSEGVNICDEKVESKSNPSTKRLIIEGGSDAFPELRLVSNSSKLTIDPVLSDGSVLRANYSISILNSGEFGVNHAITSEYQVAVKLPAGWSIVGDPASYLLLTEKVAYQGLDAQRGYIFNVVSNVNVNEVLSFDEIPLKYTLSNEINLSCNHNFGNIQILIFQNIEVDLCLAGVDCRISGIDQVLFEEFVPMDLPVESALSIFPANQFPVICSPNSNGNSVTLADVILENTTNVYHLDWYENEQEAIADLPATRLPLTTPLVNGRTYYVINRFVYNGTCKSNVGKIKVTLSQNNLSGSVTTSCNDANGTYQVKVVLNGTAPFSVSGTGAPGNFVGNVWTSNPIASGSPFDSGTPYQITFTDKNNCTPFVASGQAPICCTLVFTAPTEKTVNCGSNFDTAVTGLPTVVKSCGLTNLVYQDSEMTACVAGLKSFTRTFTVTDAKGNVERVIQTIKVKDEIGPTFNGSLSTNITVFCASEVPAISPLTALDNCGVATVATSDVIEKDPNSCANNYVIKRTYTATDSCGNKTTHLQIITVNDTVKPQFVGNLPGDITVSCTLEIPTAISLNAIDNCSNDVMIINAVEVKVGGSCEGNFKWDRTWTATDTCGNKVTHTQNVFVEDKTAPEFKVNPVNKIVECDY